MRNTTRRNFLETVGGGMLVVGLGTSLSTELGLRSVFADETPRELSFGRYDALVDLMQNNSPEKLQPILIEKLAGGETNIKDLIAAGADGQELYLQLLAVDLAEPLDDPLGLPQRQRAASGCDFELQWTDFNTEARL